MLSLRPISFSSTAYFNKWAVVDTSSSSRPAALAAGMLSARRSSMLGNTLTLPQVGGDKVLVKISEQNYSSEYLLRSATDEYRARIRHTKVGPTATRPYTADRHNFEVVQTVFAAGGVEQYERKFYFVIETKPGDTATNLADAVADLMILTSNAFLVSLNGWES